MDVRIIPSIKEAHTARGAVVVLDIFRASNTITALLMAGAERLFLLASLEEAFALREKNPDWLLFGERKGLMLPGMDGDNSPSKASGMDLRGRTAILTTSAGTQPLPFLREADGPVFYGCFPGAAALLSILRSLKPETVNLLPLGRETILPVVEDTAGAEYLYKSLRGEPVDFADLRAAMLASESADSLRKRGLHDDLEFCTSLDTCTLVPVVDLSGPYPEARAWDGKVR